MTFMERTSLRSECRRLTRFLRLVDFVVVDTLRDLVNISNGAPQEATCASMCWNVHVVAVVVVAMLLR